MEIYGAHIEKGLQDWQIIQRHDGFGRVSLQGTFYIPDAYKEIMQCVQMRVVEEASNRVIINWENCETVIDESGVRGTWQHTMDHIPEGGLYRLETKCFSGDYVWGNRGDMRHHIGVGDIYCIIGQSNSTGYGRDHATDAPELGVHLYRCRGAWDLATHPFGESTGTLYPANLEASNPGSSPYLSFGKMLKKALNVPVGLIPAAQGGSPICDWIPAQNGYLYRNMAAFLDAIGNDFTGFLWYQGCTDAERDASRYPGDFKLLVEQLRKDYGMKPILTTQLNKMTLDYQVDDTRVPRFAYGVMRGHQRNMAHEIENVYVVPSYDLPTSDEVHNSCAANIVIGERLAEVALDAIYHKPGYQHAYAADVRKITRISADTVDVVFDHCEHLVALAVPTYMMPFVAYDEKGELALKSWAGTSQCSMSLTFERELVGDAYVCLVPSEQGAFRAFYDQANFLPPLAFWKQKVE